MQNITKPVSSTRVVTGVVRLSYANVWEPRTSKDGKPRYSVSLIIPKSDTKAVRDIQAAIEAAYKEGESKLKDPKRGLPPLQALKTPLRDGDIDRAGDPVYAGNYFINANANPEHPPQIVDGNVQPILNRTEVYSGVYARVSINFYAFDNSGNKGIACGLGNIQKVRDGEPLSGSARAEDDFEAYTDATQYQQPMPGYGYPQQQYAGQQYAGQQYAGQQQAPAYAPQQPAPGYGYPPAAQTAPAIDPITGQPVVYGI